MTGAIDDKLLAFLKGFHELIPQKNAAIFNAEELRDAMSGMPTIHVEALKQTAIYVNYVGDDVVIQWFWEVLESFEHSDKAKFLGFVTGTQRVPSDGLELTIVRSGATNRLPAGHTCAKQLDLPRYSTKEQLRDKLLKAIQGCDRFCFG
ncbi:E3 ubiquitin-protein ligase HUWE1-like [Brassica napus]|uniref:E3 ubiquitin-protein ligase HUWE1-like n=1 Tax=Brassica napus TaxID=3708 RepID=UPI000BBE402B|nr:E3 ubiquitin-protein ligase HUWE1-like [Brassica napus]